MTGDEHAKAANEMNVVVARGLLFFSRGPRCLSDEFGGEGILKNPLIDPIRPGIARFCKPQTEPEPKLRAMIVDRIFFKENILIGLVATYRQDRSFTQP